MVPYATRDHNGPAPHPSAPSAATRGTVPGGSTLPRSLSSLRSGGAAVAALLVTSAVVVSSPGGTPALALQSSPSAVERSPFLGASPGFDDVDTRAGSVQPTSAQKAAVSGLGATVRWNQF